MAVYLCAVPGRVADLDISSLSSVSVSLSWSALDCDQRNGPTVGYSYRLARQPSHGHSPTTHDAETTHYTGTGVKLLGDIACTHCTDVTSCYDTMREYTAQNQQLKSSQKKNYRVKTDMLRSIYHCATPPTEQGRFA